MIDNFLPIPISEDEANQPPQVKDLPEYSISDLSQALKTIVENNFNFVRVRGEISQPKLYSSGHLYLRLKDDKAVLEAICWKGTVTRLSVKPEEGMEVICTGRITTYPGRSQYQLIIETLELAGQGALLKLIEDRKKKLAAEGLFDSDKKKPLPFFPQCIGLITSPTGAVLHDIMHRLRARLGCYVILWPVAVQGETAAPQIIQAIQGFNQLPETIKCPDVLIVARGGGSFEDLMPFNDENLVRAVARSRIPIVSAVGHEPDFTLIDYVADVRAPTPTAAAEIIVPVKLELESKILNTGKQLNLALLRLFSESQLHLRASVRGLGDPKNIVLNYWQTLEDRSQRLTFSLKRQLEQYYMRVYQCKLKLIHPRESLKQLSAQINFLAKSLDGQWKRFHEIMTHRIKTFAPLLEGYSFKNVLARGYVFVTDDNHHPITKGENLKKGRKISLHFQDSERNAVIDADDTLKKPLQGKLF